MIKYLVILAIILAAWCPWLTKEEALEIVNARVLEMRAEDPNLCAMTVYRDSIQKVPFGYIEKVSYDCTVTDEVYGVFQSRNTVFITFYKQIIGMPHKSIVNKL